MRRPVVLHADPHADTRDLLACMLREYAIDVIGAEDGGAAYEKTLSERPDLLVTELRLPVVDGVQLCARLRANPDLRHTPVIAWTGWRDIRTQQPGAAAFDRIILKGDGTNIVAAILSMLVAQGLISAGRSASNPR